MVMVWCCCAANGPPKAQAWAPAPVTPEANVPWVLRAEDAEAKMVEGPGVERAPLEESGEARPESLGPELEVRGAVAVPVPQPQVAEPSPPAPAELRITFRAGGEECTATFRRQPLGFTLKARLPVVVHSVHPGSEAANAGIQRGSELLAINGGPLPPGGAINTVRFLKRLAEDLALAHTAELDLRGGG